MAQLGARFHGMEEVIGSIPIRSTNNLYNLARSNYHKRIVCVMVCAEPYSLRTLNQNGTQL